MAEVEEAGGSWSGPWRQEQAAASWGACIGPGQRWEGGSADWEAADWELGRARRPEAPDGMPIPEQRKQAQLFGIGLER